MPNDEGHDWLGTFVHLATVAIVVWQLWTLVPEHRRDLLKRQAKEAKDRLMLPIVVRRALRHEQSMLTWETMLVREAVEGYHLAGGGTLAHALDLA